MKTNFSRYEPMNRPGVVDHQFINASDAPGQYEAEQCNRQAVTARWLFDHPDVQGYVLDTETHDMGLDGWRLVDGVDALRDGSKIIIDFGVREVAVAPDYVVYAARAAVIAAEGLV